LGIVEKVYRCMGQRAWVPEAYDAKKPMWSGDESAWEQARQQVIDLLRKAGRSRLFHI